MEYGSWGASPIYLLGKYFLGVQPCLGTLEWMEGVVPLPSGQVEIFMDKSMIKVTADATGTGYLRFQSSSRPVVENGSAVLLGNGLYEVAIVSGKEYSISYR